MVARIWLGVLIGLFSLTAFAESRKVAALYWSSNIEGQVAMRKGLESEAARYNKKSKPEDKIEIIPFVAGDGKAGIKNQIEQFAKAISLKPAVIIIQPTDNAALSYKLQEANRLKIPVVAFDQYIVGGDLEAFVTSDNYQAGRLNAEYISSFYPKETQIRIVVFAYPKVSSTTDRLDGFFDTLRHLDQDFQVLKTYEAVEPIGGKKAAQDFLKDFPQKGSVDVIVSVNDGGGIAIVKELQAAGRTEIKHATVDGDPESIKNIVKNNITVIDSAQFCGEIGRQSFVAAADLLNGRVPAKKILVPTFPVTAKTASMYSGWMSDIPATFRKEWTKDRALWESSIKRIQGRRQ
ncbi:MAG: sugar ABC transporter substrate-binding protein [Bdellovibrionales bacterium]|nr:sugar ABC transporter substrate-binding protein [Bdellovibrionales bacterium]